VFIYFDIDTDIYSYPNVLKSISQIKCEYFILTYFSGHNMLQAIFH